MYQALPSHRLHTPLSIEWVTRKYEDLFWKGCPKMMPSSNWLSQPGTVGFSIGVPSSAGTSKIQRQSFTQISFSGGGTFILCLIIRFPVLCLSSALQRAMVICKRTKNAKMDEFFHSWMLRRVQGRCQWSACRIPVFCSFRYHYQQSVEWTSMALLSALMCRWRRV